jgi:uncharacterized membrane protein
MADLSYRSFAKSVSWRVVGTLDTFLLSWLLFGSLNIAAPIAATEVATKIFLYFIHERVWNLVRWGRKNEKPTRIRSLTKAISWRIFGSVDTFLIAFFWSENVMMSIAVGSIEVITKLTLFYLHERTWALIGWGRRQIGVYPRKMDKTG